MFEFTWTKLVVVTVGGAYLVGKKDLPRAANMFGTQIGRIVGFLQGARARADQFTEKSELRQLHEELRSGMRELDLVKSELAVSMSSRGMVGNHIGTMTNRMDAGSSSSGRNNNNNNMLASNIASPASPPSIAGTASMASVQNVGANNLATPVPFTRTLPPTAQTIAAVAEEEWVNRGIQFKSRAEQGSHVEAVATSGSVVLANLIKQSLIYDQHDRVVQEQDAVLQSKVREIVEKRQSEDDSAKAESNKKSRR